MEDGTGAGEQVVADVAFLPRHSWLGMAWRAHAWRDRRQARARHGMAAGRRACTA